MKIYNNLYEPNLLQAHQAEQPRLIRSSVTPKTTIPTLPQATKTVQQPFNKRMNKV